jgi:hypothetical protein
MVENGCEYLYWRKPTLRMKISEAIDDPKPILDKLNIFPSIQLASNL